MNRIGFLGPDVVAAHCVWLDDTDRKLLAEKGVGCVHNPSSNMMLASGVAPVVEERAAALPWASAPTARPAATMTLT